MKDNARVSMVSCRGREQEPGEEGPGARGGGSMGQGPGEEGQGGRVQGPAARAQGRRVQGAGGRGGGSMGQGPEEEDQGGRVQGPAARGQGPGGRGPLKPDPGAFTCELELEATLVASLVLGAVEADLHRVVVDVDDLVAVDLPAFRVVVHLAVRTAKVKVIHSRSRSQGQSRSRSVCLQRRFKAVCYLSGARVCGLAWSRWASTARRSSQVLSCMSAPGGCGLHTSQHAQPTRLQILRVVVGGGGDRPLHSPTRYPLSHVQLLQHVPVDADVLDAVVLALRVVQVHVQHCDPDRLRRLHLRQGTTRLRSTAHASRGGP